MFFIILWIQTFDGGQVFGDMTGIAGDRRPQRPSDAYWTALT